MPREVGETFDRPTRLLLIRHAESSPDPAIEEAEWPLSGTGLRQARQLTARLEAEGVTEVYSSPYRRAAATVEPFAQARGLDVRLEPDLRERRLTPGFHPRWRDVIEQAWRDLDFRLPGCESGVECQARVRNCIERLAQQHPGATIAAASHGNALALYLTLLDPGFGYEGWSKMRNPDVFVVEFNGPKPELLR